MVLSEVISTGLRKILCIICILHALGTGGNPFTDGGDIHLNGLISGMQIRSQSEIDAIQVLISNLASLHFLAIFRSAMGTAGEKSTEEVGVTPPALS